MKVYLFKRLSLWKQKILNIFFPNLKRPLINSIFKVSRKFKFKKMKQIFKSLRRNEEFYVTESIT